MILALDLSPIVIWSLIWAGLAVVIVGNLWTMVVAAQRSVLWLIAVLLLPITGLILLALEPKSRVPFLVSMLGIGMVVGGVFAADPEVFRTGTFGEQLVRTLQEGGDAIRAGSWDRRGTLEERQRRIRAWQADLEARRTALRPGDTTARAAFDRELQRYLDALEKLKAEMAAPPNP